MILNTTKNHSERYQLLPGSMGCAGEPPNHANHHFKIVNGIDRGNGYQGYMSVSYFLSDDIDYVPASAKAKVRRFLKSKNLIW